MRSIWECQWAARPSRVRPNSAILDAWALASGSRCDRWFAFHTFRNDCMWPSASVSPLKRGYEKAIVID